MPAPARPAPASHPTVLTSLEELATEADALGLCAAVREPAGHPPYLHLRNPEANVLSERVFVQAGQYHFSWAEPITGCDQPAAAAAILARVLRTADGRPRR
jgi:hypothetical protein